MTDWWEVKKAEWVRDYTKNYLEAESGLEDMKSEVNPAKKYFKEILDYSLKQFETLPHKVYKYDDTIAGKLGNILITVTEYKNK